MKHQNVESLIETIPMFATHLKTRSIYDLCCFVIRARQHSATHPDEHIYMLYVKLSAVLMDLYPALFSAALKGKMA